MHFHMRVFELTNSLFFPEIAYLEEIRDDTEKKLENAYIRVRIRL